MRRILCGLMLLVALVALAPQGAVAQALATLTVPAVPSITIPSITTPSLTLPGLPAQHLTAGHAMALGVGLFAGAVAATVLINGGAMAAAIGAVAGLTVGQWAWSKGDID